MNAYFNSNTAEKVLRQYGKADVITATNVVAHVDNLHDFFKGISHLLKDDGVLITEFPYFV